MRVLRFNISLAVLFSALFCFGQQSIEFSQYTLNLKGINPATVGANDMINVLGTFRSQYAGFENAPITYYVSADLGFKIAQTKHGAGISFYDNMAGIYRYQDINLMYAYRIGLKKGDLALGALVDFSTTSINKDKVKNVESEYHDSSDPALSGECNDFKVDLGVGVSYMSPKWYAGVSLLNILQPQYRMTERIYFKKKMNLKFMGGYNISFTNPLYRLRTYANISTDFVTFTGQIGANIEYKESYWGGIGYRINGAVVFMAGIRVLNGLVIGYSFDLPTSRLIRSAGCHEILLSYSFNIDLSKKNKYKSIRYL